MGNFFQDHNIDPSKKDKAWILKRVKALWDECESSSGFIFNKAKDAYDKIDDYWLARQSIEKYKPVQGIDPGSKTSHLAIDWTPRSIAQKLMDIMLSKILGRGYNIVCTPIDPIAKQEADNYYNRIRSRIMLRETAQASGLDPNSFPALMREPGEPEDLEELEMQMKYGFKMNLAMEAEMGVDLILFKNKFGNERKLGAESLTKYGVAVYKEDVDENGDIYVRNCYPGTMIVSPCERFDFNDKRYVGEIKSVPISQIALKFSGRELEEICATARTNGRVRNSYTNYNASDNFNVQVLDVEFKSWNTKSYKFRVNSTGNLVVRYEDEMKQDLPDETIIYNGDQLPRYRNSTKEVIYKAKWIIGTEYVYDEGLATDMKRARPNRALTDFSYHIDAPNFKDMVAISKMDQLIPVIDEYMNTCYKIQNFKSRWIPYIVDIDFDAIENIPLGKGGKNLTKKEVLDLVLQKFILPNRRKDISGTNINYKAVDVRTTGMHSEFVVLTQDLVRLLNEMRDIVGLNEITDGTTPNANLLNGVAALGAEATNNALRPLMDSDKRLVEAVAEGVIRRLVHVVKKKKVEGLLPALGSNSMQYFSLAADVAQYDWGLKIEDRPTDMEKAEFMQRLKIADANGQINPEDYVIIMNCTNLKQAGQLLAYRMEKRRKQNEQYQLALQQMNGRVQQDSARVAEEEKRKTMQAEHSFKMEQIDLTKDWDMRIALEKNKVLASNKEMDNISKLAVEGMKQETLANQSTESQST